MLPLNQPPTANSLQLFDAKTFLFFRERQWDFGPVSPILRAGMWLTRFRVSMRPEE